MFSGIIEAKSSLVDIATSPSLVRLRLARPEGFGDLKPGDSVAVNGVCLTVEEQTPKSIDFALGPETLKVTGWSEGELRVAEFNLERSLRLGDRLHGHMVSGHVDGLCTLLRREVLGESQVLDFEFSKSLIPYIWPKGSVAINGVSLTLNQVTPSRFQVCLIPETLERTNLGGLEVGQKATLEVDQLARGLHWRKSHEV